MVDRTTYAESTGVLMGQYKNIDEM